MIDTQRSEVETGFTGRKEVWFGFIKLDWTKTKHVSWICRKPTLTFSGEFRAPFPTWEIETLA